MVLGSTAFGHASVLALESDRARQRLREAIEIRVRQPDVNLNSGWVLL